MCWIFAKLTYLRVCWRSTIDLCLMNLPKRSSFKSVLKVYTLSKILLWIKPSYFSLENACYSWCMHQTGLFSSASVVPQSKFTGELWSSASVVPQSKSTEMWSSAAPFHHDLWYFRHWTNEHFTSMLFIRKNVTSPQSRHSSHWNRYNRPNYWKGYWREPHTHSTEGFDDSLETCEIECQ